VGGDFLHQEKAAMKKTENKVLHIQIQMIFSSEFSLNTAILLKLLEQSQNARELKSQLNSFMLEKTVGLKNR